MTKLPLGLALLVLGACATGTVPQEIEAVRDYIVAAELPEVDEIRYSRQLSHGYVNDRFVTVPTRRGDYLVELTRDCPDLRRNDFTPEMIDRRTSTNVIRPRFDTIRGCHIDKMYALTEEQYKELKSLGDAPGDEVFIPDEEEP